MHYLVSLYPCILILESYCQGTEDEANLTGKTEVSHLFEHPVIYNKLTLVLLTLYCNFSAASVAVTIHKYSISSWIIGACSDSITQTLSP